jgi:HTH-type transcriptional regulator/antitoxin HigA
VGKNGGTTEQDEQDADVWSRDELIPLEAFKMLKEKQNFSVASVKKFAKENRIATGIVVGRLQNEGCIEYNMLNELKEHYVITV